MGQITVSGINYDELGDRAFQNNSPTRTPLINQNRPQQRPQKSQRPQRIKVTSFYGTTPRGKVFDGLSRINEEQKTLLLATGFNDDPEAFSDVSEFQQSLNDYFASLGDYNNQIKVDGKYGRQTDRAFRMAILAAKSQMPENSYENNIPQINNQIKIVDKPILLKRNNSYNRSNIRDIIRSNGYNPYNFTGDQRRALRLYLNGESNDTSLLNSSELQNIINKYYAN